MSGVVIWHEDRAGRKFKWSLKGTKTELDAIRSLFGEGKPVVPRNKWGPAGLPAYVKRERALEALAEAERLIQESEIPV